MAKQRIGKLARDLKVGVASIVDFLRGKGVDVEGANATIDDEAIDLIQKEFGPLDVKPKGTQAAPPSEPTPIQSVGDAIGVEQEQPAPAPQVEEPIAEVEAEKPEISLKVKGKIGLPSMPAPAAPAPEPPAPEVHEPESVETAPAPEPEPAAVEPQPPVEEVVAPPAPQVEEPVPPVEAPAEVAPVKEPVVAEEPKPEPAPEPEEVRARPGLKVVGHIDLEAQRKPKRAKSAQPAPAPSASAPSTPVEEPKPAETPAAEAKSEPEVQAKPEQPQGEVIFRSEVEKLSGPTVVGRIDLDTLNDRTRRRVPEASATPGGGVQKRRRRKLVGSSDGSVRPPAAAGGGTGGGAAAAADKKRGKVTKKAPAHAEISMEDVEEKIKETRARIVSKRSGALSKGAKYRKEKRSIMEARRGEEMERTAQERQVLRISEFVSVNELAGMMEVPVTAVIETCMNMGLMVSINQRLDAESLALVADEFGFKIEFISTEIGGDREVEDLPEDLVPRPPIFTVLGHVDHGKTTLCDTIRKSNVTAGEKGGITQHLGAYSLTLPNGRRLTLIDTPGHEAFTAMRARGAKLTDVAIIVVSAEDGLMPQTMEAINHASVTGARLVFAINKVDSPKANPEKVKEELANHNYLVEEWGGKFQSQDISAKYNKNVDLLLEKVLLEADVMDLKANPNRKAECTVIESTIDKGRGHCANVLVRTGTLRKGAPIVSGAYFGRVKALYDDRGEEVKEAGPSMPVMVVGLNGAPQAGDSLVMMDTDKEARTAAMQIGRIRRMQEMRARKHITLDEIGRRIAIGSFQELNIIVKGDVDGSVEALSDSLIQLSTDEIQVNVVHRGVGQITESDVTLATSSNAVIVGFQVRPSIGARRLAENEQIDIRLYSIIYDAIEEIKSAMEGMLMPEVKEEIVGTAEVMETFHISKVGTIAGSMVREGRISKGCKVRIIREGIVVYTSELSSLRRFKDEVKEVTVGMDCGIGVKGYNDIKVGDFLEAFKETEVKRTL